MTERLDVSMSTKAARERVSKDFFTGTGATYDRVVALTTFGLDKRWKRALLEHVPPESTRILDLACGTGIVLERLHARCPNAKLVGVDFTADYLSVAKQRFAGRDIDVQLLHANAEEMVLEGTFDAVTSSYIPKYVDPDLLLARIANHVRPGTTIALHDFAYPRGLGRFFWRRWMRLLKRFGPRIWPAWKTCFDENLEELIRRSKWHRRYPEALARHGWTDIAFRKLSWRTAGLVTARKA